jgi:hypothetical protein
VKQYDQKSWVLESWRDPFSTLVRTHTMDLLLALGAQAKATCCISDDGELAEPSMQQSKGQSYGVEVPSPFAERHRWAQPVQA